MKHVSVVPVAFTRRLLAPAVVMLLTVGFAPAAGADVLSCELDPHTNEVSIEFEGTMVIERQAGSPNILVDGAVCSSSDPGVISTTSVHTVDSIQIDGSSGDDYLILSLANGQFAPGETAECAPPCAPSEIEFSVSFGDGLDILEVVGSPGPDRLTFGAGPASRNQRALATNSDFDAEVLFSRADVIIADGGDGSDVLQGLGGHGTGVAIADPLTLLGGALRDTVIGGQGDDGLSGGIDADDVRGSGGNDGVTGSEHLDLVSGGRGNDVLENFGTVDFPVPGNDIFAPGPGNDMVIGTTAGEFVTFESSTAPVTVNLDDGVANGEGTDSLTEIEHVIGSSFDDSLKGTDASNSLTGGPGDDVLLSGGGIDILRPGIGADEVEGGTEEDILFYSDVPTGMIVDLALGQATPTDGDGSQTDSLASIERVVGTRFPDVLRGSSASDNLNGIMGTDELSGFGGDDTLTGGSEDDDLFGHEGADTLSGGEHNDDLFGNAGNDRLFGEAGNDSLDGGPNTDTCTQGTGTGTLINCENVGAFELKPRRAEVSAGEPLDYLLTWTHPRRWRRLDTVELRIRDGARVLAWVRWNQEGNTFQLFDPRADRFGPAGAGGSRRTLNSPFAVLHLRGSDQVVFDTATIGVLMRLSFRPSAAGDLIVEATAEDDRNNRMAWERAGTLKLNP